MRPYRLLLRLYPRSFRDEYGADMAAIFARRVAGAGAAARIPIWVAAAVDTVRNAALVHADILRQDVRYVARSLRRAPGFAAAAVAVVALGIGATTAAFSIADFALLRPLPFPEPDRLVHVWEAHPGLPRMDLSPANYRDLKRLTNSFETLGAYRGLALNLMEGGEPLHLQGAVVGAEVFAALRVAPLLGRLFTAEDERGSAPDTLLVSYRLWQTRFGGSDAIVGHVTRLDGRPYTIIGVMPATFCFPNQDAELWTPARFMPAEFQDRNDNYLYTLGRLRAGVSFEQARADVALAGERLRSEFPVDNAHTDLTVVDLRDDVSDRSQTALMALGGAALCVLLIACANLANLLLARGSERARELAVRSAVGAGRERLTRQLLTESAILAVVGGTIGVALAAAAIPLLSQLVPTTLPVADAPAVDLRVLLFAIVASVATGVLFGLVPVMRIGRERLAGGLAMTSRSGGGNRQYVRSVLVVAEIAASVVLLVSTGLLIKALWRVQSIDPGFSTERILTLRTALPMPQYETEAARAKFYARVLPEVRRLPDVRSAAYVGFAPLRGGPNFPVGVDGHAPQDRSLSQVASLNFVTPGYFSTIGIPLREGRDVADTDTRDRPFVAVVSESFVRRYSPGRNPIGRHFTFALGDREVVGVVGDVRSRGLERTSEPQVYLPYRQVADNMMVWHSPKDLIVRVAGDPLAVAPAIRAIVRRADPEQPISDLRTLDALVAEQFAPRALQVRVLAAFAAIAFALAAVGIHSLLSFVVSQRSQEIGVRVALGAQPRDILAMIAAGGVRLGAIGIAGGVGVAYAAARWMNALLAGVHPDDATTFAAAVALVAVMVAIGMLVPAVRALSVDPISAIRAE